LAYVKFAEAIGVSLPISRKPFDQCKIDTQQKKGAGARKMRKIIYKIVAPNYEDDLEKLDLAYDSTSIWSSKHTEKLIAIMEAFADSYHSATSSNERKAILSIVAPVLSYNEIIQVTFQYYNSIFNNIYIPNYRLFLV
jgi:hypothetical protein